MTSSKAVSEPTFRLFRKQDAIDYGDMEEVVDSTPVVAKGLVDFYDAGGGEGVEVKVLFTGNGFSLVYAWFKSAFPLARHSHDQDCLYYIISGTIRVGTEVLGAGEGFFVGKDVPYTHTAGPEGAEVLEFRNAEAFTTKFIGAQAYWDRALATIAERRDAWAKEQRPGDVFATAD
jgi:mannose-6-phosphate isomerase-like protein (cupin superfamily)